MIGGWLCLCADRLPWDQGFPNHGLCLLELCKLVSLSWNDDWSRLISSDHLDPTPPSLMNHLHQKGITWLNSSSLPGIFSGYIAVPPGADSSSPVSVWSWWWCRSCRYPQEGAGEAWGEYLPTIWWNENSKVSAVWWMNISDRGDLWIVRIAGKMHVIRPGLLKGLPKCMK